MPQQRPYLTALGAWLLKAPIHAYRWTLRPWLGWPCRHLPTCSDYALEAIDKNGPWRGLWLTISRLSRCRPGGTAGFDPVPDTRHERHPLLPWRHGRWGKGHMPNTSHNPD
ncbi:MAG: membrane protein insertion efficiency factor YidD [Hyphomicrobiaceae bacterium]